MPLVPRDPKKNANAHFVSFFDERKKRKIAKIKKIVHQKKEKNCREEN